MRNEISSAVDFLSKIVQIRGSSIVDLFKENLSDILCEHYQNHWFPEKSYKGSAYRCIRISDNKMDPLVCKAGASCGISESQLIDLFPKELTMWIDPEDVSYRFGEDGSIGVLYDGAVKEATPDTSKQNQNTLQTSIQSSNGQSRGSSPQNMSYGQSQSRNSSPINMGYGQNQSRGPSPHNLSFGLNRGLSPHNISYIVPQPIINRDTLQNCRDHFRSAFIPGMPSDTVNGVNIQYLATYAS